MKYAGGRDSMGNMTQIVVYVNIYIYVCMCQRLRLRLRLRVYMCAGMCV